MYKYANRSLRRAQSTLCPRTEDAEGQKEPTVVKQILTTLFSHNMGAIYQSTLR